MTESETGNGAAPAVGDEHSIAVSVFGRTDVGLIREHNEDNFLIADLTNGNRSIKPEVRNHTVGSKGSLFAVCDGMGGAAAGEVASRIAVDTVYEMMQNGADADNDEELARRLDAAIKEAGTRIYTAARVNRGQRGMGTTITAAVLTGRRLLIGQVGDSRAHIVRQGELVQVTKDQSLVQQLIDAKQLTEEEAKSFDKSNIILQALGTTEEVHVDMTSVELCRGDTLVMCSDGLSGLVEPEAIRDAALEIEDPMEACRKLTDMACDMGGDDNITVIVARFAGVGLPDATGEIDLAYERFEYPKTGEVTVRSAYPKDPNAPPEDDTEQVEQVGEEQEAPAAESTGAPAESAAAERPDDAAADGAGAEPDEPAPAGDEPGAGETADEAEEDAEQADIEVSGSSGKKGPLIAVVAIVLVGAVIGAFFAMRGGNDPAAAGSADVTIPGAPPVVAPGEATAEGAAPADLAAPPLAPIDEQDIMGKGKRAGKHKGDEFDSASTGSEEEEELEPEPEPEEEPEEAPYLSPKVDKSIEGEPLEASPWEPKKKSGKKKSGKKKKQVIDDNPYE